MSKRLQVLLPDNEYSQLRRFASAQKKSVADVVRESIRNRLERGRPVEPSQRLAALLRFTRFSGPTGDIEQLLAEIEQGRE